MNTSVEICSHKDEIKQIIAKGLGEVEAFFRKMIELGQKKKEVPANIDSQSTAKALMGTVVGIRVLGRGIYDRVALQALTEQSLRLIR